VHVLRRAVLLVLLLAPVALAQDAGVPRRKPQRDPATLTLLFFRADWCQACKGFEETGTMARVQAAWPTLPVRRVNVDTEESVRDQYGVELIPNLVLVDATGFVLARPKPKEAAILKAIEKATGTRIGAKAEAHRE
jgi:thioredoxin-like negative regulator of GroEL